MAGIGWEEQAELIKRERTFRDGCPFSFKWERKLPVGGRGPGGSEAVNLAKGHRQE